MPRRSSRAAPAPATAVSAAPKRRASARLSTAKSRSKRRRRDSSSSRSRGPSPIRKSVKSTAKQSKYFDQDTAREPDLDSDQVSEQVSAEYSESAGSEPGPTTKRRGANKKQAKKQKKVRGKQDGGNDARNNSTSKEEVLHEKELWREGVKTGLGPGKEVFIKKPKMRDPGNVPYRDDTLHPNTILFLKDLSENNERQWFKGS